MWTLKNENLANKFLLGVFVLLISAPILRLDSRITDNTENRNLASFPTVDGNSLKSFPKEFEKYINDHFGFREALLDLHGRLSANLFNDSASKRVIIGKNGWLFYTDEHSLEDIRRSDYLNEQDKLKWRASITEKDAWLASQGIVYRFVVAPDKHSIYPEMLPSHVPIRPGKSRLQDLLDTIKLPATIVDLGEPLQRQKDIAGSRLYFRTDTHWNSYGAYIGYKAIVHSLGEKYETTVLNLDDQAFHGTADKHQRDLAIFAHLSDEESDQQADISRHIACQRPGQPLLPMGLYVPQDHIFSVVCGSGIGTALVFQDSFMNSIVPYLSSHFSRIVYVWHYPDADFVVRMVRQEKPQVVIEERLERGMRIVPENDLTTALEKINHINAP
ncbi:MAG: alginate O-acetyltransferase AlgX-related protein [Methylococcales bacterium]